MTWVQMMTMNMQKKRKATSVQYAWIFISTPTCVTLATTSSVSPAYGLLPKTILQALPAHCVGRLFPESFSRQNWTMLQKHSLLKNIWKENKAFRNPALQSGPFQAAEKHSIFLEVSTDMQLQLQGGSFHMVPTGWIICTLRMIAVDGGLTWIWWSSIFIQWTGLLDSLFSAFFATFSFHFRNFHTLLPLNNHKGCRKQLLKHF